MIVLKAAAVVTGGIYLAVRVFFTWHDANPLLFSLLLGAEVFGMWRLWVETSLIGPSRPESRSPEIGATPKADAVVLVTDEPVSDVRAAVLTAQRMHGVGKVMIVDRDDRLDVAELAQRLRVTRIASTIEREFGPLVDVALEKSKPMLVVLIPADVVVLSDLIQASAPAFADPTVAVVQCRIENTNAAHNVDYGGYGLDRIRDQLMAPKLSDAGALPWVPGISVVRREAILAAGGLGRGRSGGTLDAGRRLQVAGQHIEEMPVVVGRRLAPFSDDRHLHRWAREFHERLRASRGMGRIKGRSLPKLTRRVYRSAAIQALQPLQRLTLITVLIATVFTSSLPATGDAGTLVMLWAAWHGSSLLLRRMTTRQIGFTPWITNDLRLMTTNLVVAWRVVRGSERETPLDEKAPGRAGRVTMLAVLQAAMVMTILIFGLGILRPAHGNFVTFTAMSVMVWILLASLQARSASKLQQVRQTFRTFGELRVLREGSKMAVVGVSPSGIDLASRELLKVGDSVDLAFALPQGDGESVRFENSPVVLRSSRQGAYVVSYLRFAHLSDDEFDQIIVFCSVVAGAELLRDQSDAQPAPKEDAEDHEIPQRTAAETVAEQA